MGDVTEPDMAEAFEAIAETIQEMGVTGFGQTELPPQTEPGNNGDASAG